MNVTKEGGGPEPPMNFGPMTKRRSRGRPAPVVGRLLLLLSITLRLFADGGWPKKIII
jgi:hypothetical protein